MGWSLLSPLGMRCMCRSPRCRRSGRTRKRLCQPSKQGQEVLPPGCRRASLPIAAIRNALHVPESMLRTIRKDKEKIMTAFKEGAGSASTQGVVRPVYLHGPS